jgi:glycosyltransferase involved in cell wall biosynthesis
MTTPCSGIVIHCLARFFFAGFSSALVAGSNQTAHGELLMSSTFSLSRIRRSQRRMRKIASSVLEDASIIIENHFLTRKRKSSLVILDNIFPHLLSAFRVAEYNRCLETWKSAVVYSTASAFSVIGEKRSFREVVDEYKSYYPHLGGRVSKFSAKRNLQGELAYTVFLNNAFRFIDAIEKHQMPFVFTLYPGGGFRLNQDKTDRMLERVCSSPSFRRVIVTQKISYEYLKDRGCCDLAKIEFIYGGVLPSDRLTRQMVTKKYYKQGKDTFDICFVAQKYTKGGVDKGYDVFVEVAKLLSRTHKNIFFHVVGPFDESDMEVSDIKGRINFYGARYTDFFPKFYSRMDIILSPNVPFVLSPGSFDGFPTGCCIDAGLCGVAVFCTDVLKQNIAFKDGEEIVIISRDVEEICELIENYYSNYAHLYEIARKGQKVFRTVFDLEAQMNPRLRVLSECMGKA